MNLYTFAPDVQDKDQPIPVWGKAGNTSKGWRLTVSYIEVASLLTTPNAKVEEDAIAGRTGCDCKTE